MHYFYVLHSQKDGNLYYGQTKDLKKRFELHNSGQVPATKHRRPLELIYYEGYNSKELAIKREHTVKRSGTARDALQKRIVGP